MTTVDKTHAIFMSYQGRSPRQIYIDAAQKYGCKKINSHLVEFLSDTVDDKEFYVLEELDLGGNFLGPKGCLAVLQIVQSQQRLRTLNLRGCGADDATVEQLVEILLDHPRLRSVDLSDNLDISVYSGKGLVRAVKRNSNIVSVALKNTHIGRNVAAVLHRMCEANRALMDEYFCDEWFRMKDMFLGLDVDGSGWVNIMTVVNSVIFPLVQEKLQERIKTTKPKKREDNCIDINTFMELAYLNYKTAEEIQEYAASASSGDKPALTQMPEDEAAIVKANWVSIHAELNARDAECAELGRFRIRTAIWPDQRISELCDEALKLADEAAENKEKSEGAKPVPCRFLYEAYRKLTKDETKSTLSGSFNPNGGSHLPTTTPPATQRKKSFLEPREGKKQWAMPPSMALALVKAFEGVPPKGMVAQQIFDLNIENELDFLKLSVIKPHFAKYSIPIEVAVISLEELVNLVDEHYDGLRLAKHIDLETIKNYGA